MSDNRKLVFESNRSFHASVHHDHHGSGSDSSFWLAFNPEDKVSCNFDCVRLFTVFLLVFVSQV